MTKRILAVVMTALAVTVLTGAARAQDASVESLPPSVIKTAPRCGDTEVPAVTKEIAVTFSKDMMTERMWAWCMHSPDTFPEITDPGAITYLPDKRTCVLPVKLEPGKTYVIWINTRQNNAFKDTQGNSAVPYLLVFKTK